jgi:hypothetical protein
MIFDLFGFEINFKEKVFWFVIASIKNCKNQGRALLYIAYIEDHFEFDFLYFISNRG